LRRRFDLAALADRPAADVFLEIIEFVCPPGGDIDQAIARQAMLEAIGDLAESGAGNFDELGPAELTEFFLDFVVHSIEGRIMADLGGRGITLPDTVEGVERVQAQLHDFVDGCTRGELAGRLSGAADLTDEGIARVVNEVYEAAFDLIVAAGEAAE
jgi:hypothetical protein